MDALRVTLESLQLFRNMSLKKIKRAEKKGTESVMDEKFALLFWSEFSIGNGEFHYQVSSILNTLLMGVSLFFISDH